jgi:Bacterial capsule synthesis protein PGA_cap
MIFVGDIASPKRETSARLIQVLKEHSGLFGKQVLVGNLEGLLSDRDPEGDQEPLLSNDPDLPSALKYVTDPVFCLANNHVLDLPGAFRSSVEILQKEGIAFCGAGLSPGEAGSPVLIKEGEKEVLLFNACWDFLLYNQKNPSMGVYVEEIDERKLLNEIARYRVSRPDAAIVVYLHWSLDLESLPFPMYRQFSRAMIDAGASLVLGTHSHCVQGGEKYRDGHILYGLGNFLLPDSEYAGGRLKFPAFAKLELALEWDIEKNSLMCHWYKYRPGDKQHHLEYLGSDDFESSQRLKDLSPFRGMDASEYIRYYKNKRRKKILIPVYRDYRKKTLNTFYTSLLKSRARIAHFLARMNFIKWQN